MFTRSWGKFASHFGAGLIVAGLVTWSAVAAIHDAGGPWMPTLPEPEWFQVLIGACGLLGLWWTVVFARRAWFETRRNADEAKRSADAAHEAVAVTREMAQRQLRAYIGVSRVRLIGPSSGQAGLLIKIKNYGQTPARDVRVRLIYRFLASAKDLSALALDGERPTVFGVVESGQEYTLVPIIDRMTIAENDEGIARETAMFFVVGEVTYTDISLRVRRRTFAFETPAGHFYRTHDDVQMLTCEFGNEST